MGINPETLQEETEEERRERERRTGTRGNGLHVICYPEPNDPDIFHTQHRAVCLTKPLPVCPFCPHSRFTLYYDADTSKRYERVSCPRWDTLTARTQGLHPSRYVAVEQATCDQKPFEFCPSCPSKSELVQIGLDKSKDGWYGRWQSVRVADYEVDDE